MKLSARQIGGVALESSNPHLWLALALLREVAEHAKELGLRHWQLPLVPTQLKEMGLTKTDVRELLRLGLIEPPPDGCDKRAPAPCHSAGPAPRLRARPVPGCAGFVLSEAGLRLTAAWRPLPILRTTSIFQSLGAVKVKRALPVPQWNSDARELWWHGWLIKRFRTRAESQETIIAAFQEDRWQRRIDDPLQRVANCNSRERLHEAVRGLNRNQVNAFLRFEREGTGEGVIWLVRPEARATPSGE